jgi:hypothetical protein
MNEITALLEAVREASGTEAAVWERLEGGVAPRLLGASSAAMADRTRAGAVAWDVASWARTHALRARLVTVGDRVGWLFLEAALPAEVDRLLLLLLPLVRRLVDDRERQGRELARVQALADRQQLLREMQVAQELQLKLLPSPAVVGPEARAATRMVPAESVGGDFFLLARLDADRTGVLIGDVSGHGYQSALIMALVGSLVYFLIEVMYVGEYQARLMYVFALFVFAAVLIARISIEEGIRATTRFLMENPRLLEQRN